MRLVAFTGSCDLIFFNLQLRLAAAGVRLCVLTAGSVGVYLVTRVDSHDTTPDSQRETKKGNTTNPKSKQTTMVPFGLSNRFLTMQSIYLGLLISSSILTINNVNGQQPRIVGGTEAAQGDFPFFGRFAFLSPWTFELL
jgi:hypothetical protein